MDQLPADCISCILAFTSPQDVCRLAGVSSAFRSVADSNLLWETFLPENYREIIAPSSSSFLDSLPEKALYFHLSDHPLFIDSKNSVSFSLDKKSGRTCYMVELRSKQDAESSLSLRKGKIPNKKLVPKTLYGAYLVFQSRTGDYSQCFKSIISCIYCIGDKVKKWNWDRVLFQEHFTIKSREDEWMEIEIVQFFIEEGDNDGKISFSFLMFNPSSNELVFKGIRIGPISKEKKESNIACNMILQNGI